MTQEQHRACYRACKLYSKLKYGEELKQTTKKFGSYTGHLLKIARKATLKVRYKHNTADIDFYVVHVDQKPLLSAEGSVKLGLIDRINSITIIKALHKFPITSETF